MALQPKKIRVMVVDDSILARRVIIDGLSLQPNIEVVGYAINAQDALSKVESLAPQVITMDVEMPGMSGIELLKQLLPVHRVPVILVSSLNLRVFDALAAGAVDFVRKPDADESREGFIGALAQKISAAALTKPRPPLLTAGGQVSSPANLGDRLVLNQVIIGLGASTGGTEATLEVLKRLPEDIPGMIIVQHMPIGFTKMYAERLNRLCRMEVREAVNGEEIRRGLVLVAPADFQARILPQGSKYIITCRTGEKVSGHRPSVDALFLSMAEQVRRPMVGIIMTGMGRDGADGLLAMRNRGAFTIGQDKDSCVVYGMPQVAYEIGAVQMQAPCDKIADILLRHLNSLK